MNKNKILPWMAYTKATIEALAGFYAASFALAMFFIHQGTDSIGLSILMVALYLFIVGGIIRLVVKRFSLGALMLIVPIAPLLVLIIFVTMIPILEKLQ